MLGELETDETVVIADLEAGVGTLTRLADGMADVVLVVVEPSAKSIEAGRRAAAIASPRSRVIVVANRVRDDNERAVVAQSFEGFAVVSVPEDRAIARADREGIAPIDHDPSCPGVVALIELSRRLAP